LKFHSPLTVSCHETGTDISPDRPHAAQRLPQIPGFLAAGLKKGREPAMTVIHADFHHRKITPALPAGPRAPRPLPFPVRQKPAAIRQPAQGRSGWVDLAKQDGFDDLLKRALTG
jgi:hypothetical protein